MCFHFLLQPKFGTSISHAKRKKCCNGQGKKINKKEYEHIFTSQGIILFVVDLYFDWHTTHCAYTVCE